MTPHHRPNTYLFLPSIRATACLKWFAGLFVALVAAPSTHAAFVTATFNNVDPGKQIEFRQDWSSTYTSAWAGQYNFINATGGITGSFFGFCIDIDQAVSHGQIINFDKKNLAEAPIPGTAMGAFRASLIMDLWELFFDSIYLGNDYYDDVKAAAFQVAIWEIINEYGINGVSDVPSLDVASGAFKMKNTSSTTNDIINQANAWLNDSRLNGSGTLANLVALTNNYKQDFVVELPTVPGGGGQGGEATPAPSSLIMLLSGGLTFLGIYVYRRRRLSMAAA